MSSIADSSPIGRFTNAPARIQSVIEFKGIEPDDVFELMGDPDRITDWYVLAKTVHHHPPGPDGEARFNVEFTFFGDVFEEVLEWQPPNHYVYRANGPDFPIQDYVAEIRVDVLGEGHGRMTWTMCFDQIEGEHNRRVIPSMLPAVTLESVNRLAPLLRGTVVEFRSNFDGMEDT